MLTLSQTLVKLTSSQTFPFLFLTHISFQYNCVTFVHHMPPPVRQWSANSGKGVAMTLRARRTI